MNDSSSTSPPTSPPTPPPAPRRSRLGLGLMTVFMLLVLSVLASLSLGLTLVVLGVLGVAGLHYLLWGWWLGKALRREAEEEQQTP